jgi:hypothetical protein
VKEALYLFVLSDDLFGLIASVNSMTEGEEENAYVVWIRSQPILRSVSASRCRKVADIRVVGRLRSFSTLRAAC